HRPRLRDAAGTVPSDHLRARAGGVPGPPAAGPEDRGHAAHPRSPVRRDAHRRGDHRRRPDLLPRPCTRSPRGRPLMTTLTQAPHGVASQRVAAGLLAPKMLLTSLPDALRKLD